MTQKNKQRNQKTIKIAEIFESIQGEGRFVGTPMLFVRTSGCTRICDFCDTKYHNQGKDYQLDQLIQIIKDSKLNYVCWTGGEPLLRLKEILQIIDATSEKMHHIETNGDLIKKNTDLHLFDYIACSPKTTENIKIITKKLQLTSDVFEGNYDIKVVVDFKKDLDLMQYATILMPKTEYNQKKDLELRKKVWDYCVKNNIKYSPRLQVEIFGKKKNV